MNWMKVAKSSMNENPCELHPWSIRAFLCQEYWAMLASSLTKISSKESSLAYSYRTTGCKTGFVGWVLGL